MGNMDVLVESKRCIFCDADYGHMKYEGTSMLKIHMYSMHAVVVYRFLNDDRTADEQKIRNKVANFVEFMRKKEVLPSGVQQEEVVIKMDAAKQKTENLHINTRLYDPSSSPIYEPPTIKDFGIDRQNHLDNSSTVDGDASYVSMDISPPISQSSMPGECAHEPLYEVPYAFARSTSRCSGRSSRTPLLPDPAPTPPFLKPTPKPVPKPDTHKADATSAQVHQLIKTEERKPQRVVEELHCGPVLQNVKEEITSPEEEEETPSPPAKKNASPAVKRSVAQIGKRWGGTMKKLVGRRASIGKRRSPSPAPARQRSGSTASAMLRGKLMYLKQKFDPLEKKKAALKRGHSSSAQSTPVKQAKFDFDPHEGERDDIDELCRHWTRPCRNFGTRRCRGARCMDIHPLCSKAGNCPGEADGSCPFRHSTECARCADKPRSELFACPHHTKRSQCRHYTRCKYMDTCHYRHMPCPQGRNCENRACPNEHYTTVYLCHPCRGLAMQWHTEANRKK